MRIAPGFLTPQARLAALVQPRPLRFGMMRFPNQHPANATLPGWVQALIDFSQRVQPGHVFEAEVEADPGDEDLVDSDVVRALIQATRSLINIIYEDYESFCDPLEAGSRLRAAQEIYKKLQATEPDTGTLLETDFDLCPEEEDPELDEAIRVAARQAMDAALAAWFVRWNFYNPAVYKTLFGPEWESTWQGNPLILQMKSIEADVLQDHYRKHGRG